MPRARKKAQKFHFPQEDQPSAVEKTDAEIDADIDSSKVDFFPSVEKVSAKTKEKKAVEKALKEIPEIFTPEQVAWAFDVYVVIICFVFSILLKCEFQLLHDELKIDDNVKLLWAKPLVKVLNKHSPAHWAGLTAEIELFGCLALWTATAFGRARTLVQKVAEEKKVPQQQKPQQQHSNVVTVQPREREVIPV